ncbi:MAG TPA: SpoIID/LytB domain-containing protein [Pyrinomonadaceae bacterium]|nr:SpoIID/LytB domain-containing protein [Pyrinomonadaceae bacterium]
MRSSFARRFIALLVLPAQFLSFSVLSQGQQSSHDEIRPRRINNTEKQIATLALSSEPKIRVGLATNLRSATVSTTSRLMSTNETGSTHVPLDVAQVRLEPRMLSPRPVISSEDNYRLQVAGAASRDEAEQKAKEIREAFDEDSQVVLDAETNTWGLRVGSRLSRAEAEELSARLNDAGFDSTVFESTLPSPPPIPSSRSSDSAVRLAARPSLPSREVVGFSGAARSFSSSAPVVLMSDDEARAPVRLNNRPYRGRIEVFANTRGTLTVVNVIGLEDYVRGVVANELSPGGYPSIEALKAQAIAARTYALRNRGQFMSQGFDILPTTRSQVYRGVSSEHPLSTRAVDETRGIIATYNGEPINALYTSTCGGRTEDAGNIFNHAVPYLVGHECGIEGTAALSTFTVRTSREPAELRDDKNLVFARDVALLAAHNFSPLPSRVSDDWLEDRVSLSEVRHWLTGVARLARQTAPVVTEDIVRPPAFATALNTAVFGENRADTLLNNLDVEYLLAMRDSGEIPQANRADVALLIRDGCLSIFPDATLRPREQMSRGRVLHAISRLLESRGLLQLQKGTARPTAAGALVLRPAKGKEQTIRVSNQSYLFREIGESLHPVSAVMLVGGEPVMFHVNSSGEVDYLEVRPAPSGAAAERFSPFTNWTKELSLGQVQARLARAARGIGPIDDLRVAARGTSRRVIDLEVIGREGTAHVRGGRIRSVLGLREQLFVIDRRYDSEGRVTSFIFTGRGWGHGVGMCQVGAYGLARQGLRSDEILKTYYTGIELTKMY